MFTLLLLLVLLSLLLNLFAKRPRRWILVLTFAGFYLAGTHFLAEALLEPLQPYPGLDVKDWTPKTVIVVLGAGLIENSSTHAITLGTFGYSRLLEGLKLYQACRRQQRSCRILVSGGDPGHHHVTEAQWMAASLEQAGVDKADLILEDKSNNTYQNAKFTRQILQSMTYDRVILVTSGFHMRRSVLLFSAFQIPVLPAPSDQWQAVETWLPVSYNLTLADVAFHEYLGMIQFYYYEWRGLNKL